MTQGLSSCYDDIIAYINEGLTPKSIAERAGMNELAARRLINDLVKLHGLSYVPSITDDTPFGMDQQTVFLRIHLGNLLYDLRMRLDGDRTSVSRLTGLNRTEQIRAEQRPYNHNWTLSQIQRLAKVTDTPLMELLNVSNKTE